MLGGIGIRPPRTGTSRRAYWPLARTIMWHCGTQGYVLESWIVYQILCTLKWRSVLDKMLRPSRIGNFSTRGLFPPRRAYRQSQCSSISHMFDNRHEAPSHRLGRPYGPDMAVQHDGLAPIRPRPDARGTCRFGECGCGS